MRADVNRERSAAQLNFYCDIKTAALQTTKIRLALVFLFIQARHRSYVSRLVLRYLPGTVGAATKKRENCRIAGRGIKFICVVHVVNSAGLLPYPPRTFTVIHCFNKRRQLVAHQTKQIKLFRSRIRPF